MKDTFIALIPKVEVVLLPTDFRPILPTNEIYKIITGIIEARLKCVMGKLISHNQPAFIPGGSITDNILLSHDIVRILTRASLECA